MDREQMQADRAETAAVPWIDSDAPAARIKRDAAAAIMAALTLTDDDLRRMGAPTGESPCNCKPCWLSRTIKRAGLEDDPRGAAALMTHRASLFGAASDAQLDDLAARSLSHGKIATFLDAINEMERRLAAGPQPPKPQPPQAAENAPGSTRAVVDDPEADPEDNDPQGMLEAVRACVALELVTLDAIFTRMRRATHDPDGTNARAQQRIEINAALQACRRLTAMVQATG